MVKMKECFWTTVCMGLVCVAGAEIHMEYGWILNPLAAIALGVIVFTAIKRKGFGDEDS